MALRRKLIFFVEPLSSSEERYITRKEKVRRKAWWWVDEKLLQKNSRLVVMLILLRVWRWFFRLRFFSFRKLRAKFDADMKRHMQERKMFAENAGLTKFIRKTQVWIKALRLSIGRRIFASISLFKRFSIRLAPDESVEANGVIVLSMLNIKKKKKIIN